MVSCPILEGEVNPIERYLYAHGVMVSWCHIDAGELNGGTFTFRVWVVPMSFTVTTPSYETKSYSFTIPS